jgi:hypothetical protein
MSGESYCMRLTNRRNDLVHNPLTEPIFFQYWTDESIVPPPPGSEVRITDAGENRITDAGDIRVTD